IARPRDFFDNATPSGNSTASDVLLRLAVITGDEDFERKGTAPLRALAPIVESAPTGFGRLLAGLDFHLSRPQELAIVYPESPSDARPLLDVALERYRPNLVLVGARVGEGAAVTPLLSDREAVGGAATAYVCERFTCKLPTTDAHDLRRQLDHAR
ncbi:MAG TPA: thioredoxin domain-containing protein, partial [Dehalococcoidia bacterium]